MRMHLLERYRFTGANKNIYYTQNILVNILSIILRLLVIFRNYLDLDHSAV